MNWTEEQLDKKLAYILKKKSYGNDTVRIDDFFSDEITYTESEVKIIVNKKIVEMIRAGEKKLLFNSDKKYPQAYYMEFFNITDIDIKVAVANAIEHEYRAERYRTMSEIIEEAKEKAKQEIKDRRKKLTSLSTPNKKKVLYYLESCGKISLEGNVIEDMLKNMQIFATYLSNDELKTILKRRSK